MPTIVQTFQGRVTGLWGTTLLMRGKDGKMHPLHMGDLVQRGDVILTSQDGIVRLSPEDNATAARSPAAPAGPEIDRVIRGLNEPEPSGATAAGLAFSDGGDLLPGLRVARIAEAVTPASLALPEREALVRTEPIGVAKEELRGPAIDADSGTLQATEDGAPVGLDLAAPTGIGAGAMIRVTQLPAIGELQLADGTPVTVGTVLTVAQLTSLVYVPPTDYTPGTPAGVFGYTVTDQGVTVPGGVVIQVANINDAPVGHADTTTTAEDTPVSGIVLGNDTDVDGDPLTVTQYTIDGVPHPAGSSTTLPGVGTLTMGGDGGYTFVPAPNYNGPLPPVTYTLTDGTVTTTSTLTITVTPVNDAPVAVDDQTTTPINTPIVGIPVLPNDTDPDGNPLTVTGAVLTNPAQGTVTVNPDGTLSFTPATNVTGPVVITYTVTDGQGGTDTATVTVTVGANTPPTGADSTHTIAEDTSYTVATADFGFADADAGQTLANVRIDTLPAAGTLLLNGVAVAAGALIPVADIAAGQRRAGLDARHRQRPRGPAHHRQRADQRRRRRRHAAAGQPVRRRRHHLCGRQPRHAARRRHAGDPAGRQLHLHPGRQLQRPGAGRDLHRHRRHTHVHRDPDARGHARQRRADGNRRHRRDADQHPGPQHHGPAQ
jgi:hypothetical protein